MNAFAVVVPHRQHRVAADHGLFFFRHRHKPGVGHFVGFEGFIDGKTEHERVPAGQAPLHLFQAVADALVGNHLVEEGFVVTRWRRFFSELFNDVGPVPLRAHALLDHRLDAIANHGAGVLVHRAEDHPLVVVDEQAGGNKVPFHFLFDLPELMGRADGVGGATPEVALVIDGGTLFAQIDFLGQFEAGGGVSIIPIVRKIGDPAVALDLAGRGLSGEGGNTIKSLFALLHVAVSPFSLNVYVIF